MIGEYRFFQEFFDGQIIKDESQKYKLFKVLLFSIMSAAGLFCVLAKFCNIAEFLLLEFGMLWNIYSDINKKISFIYSFIVTSIYFLFASNFGIYANAIVYVGCYMPFQLIALNKDYSEGAFIQIRKTITDFNKIIFVALFSILFVSLSLFNFGLDGRFSLLDGLSAALLICSAILRNERYFEYYVFRIFALVTSIILWVTILLKFGTTGTLCIILMYTAYLIFDIVTFIYQKKTYVNEYMLQVEQYEKIQQQIEIDEKIKVYNKALSSKSKN